ncbi:hypothetical protein CDAR_376901 [Caerostris darwini]|uniref:Uncharacterized protein n=1 Tax=Caerostris darwini TaxID=1538125 RepID=A0AAV4SSC0_9ARAC|nr:hypothetical protein CDAR_376901 [Caerostris darwini]
MIGIRCIILHHCIVVSSHDRHPMYHLASLHRRRHHQFDHCIRCIILYHCIIASSVHMIGIRCIILHHCIVISSHDRHPMYHLASLHRRRQFT